MNKNTPALHAASMILTNLIADFLEFFKADESEIRLGLDDVGGIVLKLKVSNHKLVNSGFTSADFEVFCKNHDVYGMMWFHDVTQVDFTIVPSPVKVSE